jgi:hypothetical protein
MDSLREDVKTPSCNNYQRTAILKSLFNMKYRDEVMLQNICKYLYEQDFKAWPDVNTLTRMLYFIAKFKFFPDLPKHERNDSPYYNPFFCSVTDYLLSEPTISVDSAARNLWNMYALNHYNQHLFDKLGKVLSDNYKEVSELDVANALRAFAHFKHMDTD